MELAAAPTFTALASRVTAVEATAGSSTAAGAYASSAQTAAQQASAARDQAVSAASAIGGYFAFYTTKANATASLAAIPANGFIQVFVDESVSNHHTAYQKQAGALVKVADFSQVTLMADVAAPSGDGTVAGKTRGARITSGGGTTDVALDLITAPGGASVLDVRAATTGVMVRFYEKGLYEGGQAEAQWPVAMFGAAGNYQTVSYAVITGTVVRPAGNYETTTYVVASSDYYQSGNPNTFRPSMLSVWGDVDTAIEVRAQGSTTSAGLAFCHHNTGVEVGCFDRVGMWQMGPGGRANHDVSIGRVNTKTWGVTGAVRYVPYTVATAPTAAQAGKGAIVFLTDGAAGQGFYASNGSTYSLLFAVADPPAGTPFTWTPTIDETRVSQTGSAPFKFAKDVGDGHAWYQDRVYDPTARSGDMRITFKPTTSESGSSQFGFMIGFSANPSGFDDYGSIRGGIWLSFGGTVYRIINGASDNSVDYAAGNPVVTGETFYIERVGTNWNAYRGTTLMWTVGSADASNMHFCMDFCGNTEVEIDYYGTVG